MKINCHEEYDRKTQYDDEATMEENGRRPEKRMECEVTNQLNLLEERLMSQRVHIQCAKVARQQDNVAEGDVLYDIEDDEVAKRMNVQLQKSDKSNKFQQSRTRLDDEIDKNFKLMKRMPKRVYNRKRRTTNNKMKLSAELYNNKESG